MTTGVVQASGLVAYSGAAGGGIGGIAAGGATFSTGSLIFSNSNGVSFGINGSTLTASAAAGGAGLSAGTQSVNTGTVAFSNSNNVSFGMAGSATVTGSFALNVSAAGGTSNALSGLTFSNGSGVSFGLSTGAGIGTLTASVAAQTADSAGIYVLNNTTGASSTSTYDVRSLSLSLIGALSGGWTNGSFEISVPPTSSLVGVGGITLSTAGSTISVSGIGIPVAYYEPTMRGLTTTQSNSNGTVYIQPFVVSAPVSMYRIQLLQQLTTQPQTTFSLQGTISAAFASSGTGIWGQSGTLLLMSRASTGTVAQSTNLISFYSTTYSYQIGQSISQSASTNAGSATLSFTTSGAMSFISNINSTGGVTTGSFGLSGSGTSSSSSIGANSYSFSTIASFASQVMSGVRPILIPVNTSLNPGEYWLAHIQSSGTASTNFSMQQIASLAPGIVYYTSNASGYAEMGATTSNAGSNLQQGWGSYSASSQTTTSIAMSAISGMSQFQLWFNAMAATK